jgi:hypothetical protein
VLGFAEEVVEVGGRGKPGGKVVCSRAGSLALRGASSILVRAAIRWRSDEALMTGETYGASVPKELLGGEEVAPKVTGGRSRRETDQRNRPQ